MAVDFRRIIRNLLDFYDFSSRNVLSIGAGGGQLLEYARSAKQVVAVDFDPAALQTLMDKAREAGLADRFEPVTSEFSSFSRRGDLVLFEFCLHEMPDVRSALSHARTLAPDVLVMDHGPDSPWAFMVSEEEKVATVWSTLGTLPLRKKALFETTQFFGSYDELFQKVSSQGETSIARIEKFKGASQFTIPMVYGFALI